MDYVWWILWPCRAAYSKEAILHGLPKEIAEKVAAMDEREMEHFWQLAGRLQYDDGFPQDVADRIALTEVWRSK